MMVQVFTIYGVIMSVNGMFVALTQVDFMFIRITADLIVNAHTTYYFLPEGSKPELYNEWKNASSATTDAQCAPCLNRESTDNAICSFDHELEDMDVKSEKRNML